MGFTSPGASSLDTADDEPTARIAGKKLFFFFFCVSHEILSAALKRSALACSRAISSAHL